ncbi:MAG: methyltransferase [Cyclobacteriaceae bacterium]
MSDPIFRFKQFRISHGANGLRVTTEACLFGSVVCRHFSKRSDHFNALDIGTGSGLLGLMVAQCCSQACVDAVELQAEAARQAIKNVEESPWSDRVCVHHMPVGSFQNELAGYDLIISNPPFYHRHLQSPDNPGRTLAMHTVSLGYKELARTVDRLLKDSGSFFVLYPPGPMQDFGVCMEDIGLYPVRSWQFLQRPGASPWRIVAEFRYEKATSAPMDIIIHKSEGGYHNQFIDYTRSFYLKF